MSEPLPVVSVVVPTHNAIRTIRACLESVRAQDLAGIELVVVDNFSTDGSWQVAQQLADLAFQHGPERSAQRNAGIARARAAWVLWLDSDMALPPSAVRLALETAGSARAQAVALPEVTVGTGYLAACRTLERSCYVDDPGLHNPRLLHRDLLQRVGGFDERLSGPEDSLLRHQLHARDVAVPLAPVLVTHDEGRLTLADVMRKRVYYGRSLPSFVSAQPHGLRAQGAGTARAFWRHRRRLLADPGHAAGMLGLRLAEATAYAVGYAAGTRRSRRRRG